MKISGAIICYNEELVIEEAIISLLKFCDEIVVMDSFSTDKTLDILKKYNCIVYQHEFDNHRDQKNRVIEKCSGEWIFLLDSDEYLNNALIHNIPSLINNKDGVDCWGFPRENYLDGDGPKGYPDIQTRLFKSYIRHGGHPFHHDSNVGAKNHKITFNMGCIVHEKDLDRQKRQNRLYYSLRPQDYKEIPEGAENIELDSEVIKNTLSPNAYRDYLTKVSK